MRISDWSSDVCSSDLDLNLRPSGYEPDELPDCSTPHQKPRIVDEPTSLRNKQPGTGFSRGQPLLRLGVPNLCLEIRSAAHTSELQSLLRTSYAVFCL